MNSRRRKLKYNVISNIVYQIVSIVSGFILPLYFLKYYGSEVNGLISSITQFLAVISFCECGVGAVVQAALYRPIAEKDELQISKIYVSSKKFFGNLSKILVVYMIILIFAFPFIIEGDFSLLYTGILIVAITISMLAQYYIAITYRLILNASQLSYIQMSIGTITIILNVLFSVFLMKRGISIQGIKTTSAIIYLIQPIVYKKSVDKYFNINKKITLTSEPIKQKWSGLAQHIATVVLENTDVMVLTLFSSLSNVSIYAVYHMVTNGIKMVFVSVSNSMKSLLGDMYARNQMELLNDTFSKFEFIIHVLVTFVFSVASVLIVPFIKVYTKGINDANYVIPIFGYLMCLAMAIYTIRLPYSQIVQAIGHFKETQMSAVIEAILNISISIIMVSKYGLIGVAIGTIVAMSYRTIYLVWYLSKNVLFRKISIFIKQLGIDLIAAIIIVFSTKWILLREVTYIDWVFMSVKVSMISLIIVFIIEFVLTGKSIKEMKI